MAGVEFADRWAVGGCSILAGHGRVGMAALIVRREFCYGISTRIPWDTSMSLNLVEMDSVFQSLDAL